jgi:ribosome-associated protein
MSTPDPTANDTLSITPRFALPLREVELHAVRSQGAGGQNVNKTATAIHLRFDVAASSLPEEVKARVLARRDQRLSREGVIVIKAQQHRSQEQNREAALERLAVMLRGALHTPRPRKPTRVSKAAKARRTDAKTQRGKVKALRRKDAPAD